MFHVEIVSIETPIRRSNTILGIILVLRDVPFVVVQRKKKI